MSNKSNEEENKKIGCMLKAARESFKLSQTALAESVGMTRNQISLVETGQSKATVSLLLGYCNTLHMSPNELLNFSDGEIITDLKTSLIRMNEKEQRKVLRLIQALQDDI